MGKMSERGGHVPHISDNMDDILFLSVEVTNTDSAAAIRKKKKTQTLKLNTF